MAALTAIGTAIGLTGTAATIGGTAIAAGAVGGAYALGQSQKSSSAPSAPKVSTDTGTLTPDEAKTKATKRLFRAGIVATSPTGIGDDEPLASARLR